MKKPLLLVFCKNPELGKVKTRLAKTIGEEQALFIYKKLLEKTASVLAKLEVDIHVYYSNKIEDNDTLSKIATEKKCQQGKDLGERMKNAFQESFISHNKIVIIGTDLWTLEVQDIQDAFNALENQAAVIGPSKDGGYYLLGLNQFFPDLFKQKEWGTAKVLSSTLADLNHINYHLLKEKNDVDTFSDLEENTTLKACIQ